MKLGKFRFPNGRESVGLVDGDEVAPLALSGGHFQTLAEILEADDPAGTAEFLVEKTEKVPLEQAIPLSPVDRQEIWAAGVTYTRSRKARMDESEQAASFYDLVYAAPRPELFFKATPSRVSAPGAPVRIRRDALWNVPEPELTLVLNSRLRLVGFTIGNDMSSRDIEGENPLYLPQAKVYDGCCALGPWITLARDMPPAEQTTIRLAIKRGKQVICEGTTCVARMARSFDDLVEYLGRDNTFRDGVFLLTGTGIVPDDDFTLFAGDVVEIAIDGIGTLTNPVVQG
ncbi:MAG: fumarylacetoacetate hydrolase family protein [Planctomycetia bacterium]|nr:fumarylacetoacetate hydrolase family protein [Planctomycetia bacterium]